MTEEKNAYEQEMNSRSDINFYQSALDQYKKSEEQSKKLRKPIEDILNSGDVPEAEREGIINQTLQNPQLLTHTISQYLTKLNEQAKKGENLEDIVNTAPLERLANTLGYLSPIEENKPEYDESPKHHKVLYYAVQQEIASKKGDNERVEKTAKNIKDLVANHVKSLSDNEETKTFLNLFAEKMSPDYLRAKYGEFLDKAQKYLKDKDKETNIKNYIKDVLKDESQRPIFYEILFSRQKEDSE